MKELIWQMDIKIVIVIGLLIQTVIAVTLGMLTYRLNSDNAIKNTYIRLNRNRIDIINNRLMYGKKDRDRYEEINRLLTKRGYKFYFNNMEPSRYITIKIMMSIMAAIIGAAINGILGILIGAAVGYNIINLYVKILDNRDNKAITDDIRIMLAAMRVQSSSNIYITDTIKECYYEIKNKRFKKAILEFNGDVRAKKDINEAIDILESKFNNKYIDSLCVVIKQYFKSGKSSNMLEYINKQMLALQRETIEKDKRLVEQDQIISSFIIFALITMYVMLNVATVLNTDLF